MKTIIAFALAFISLSSFAVPQTDNVRTKVFGGWKLTQFIMISADGHSAPFCTGANGVIIYERSGNMSVAINCAANGVGTEPADEYGRMLFYSGKYTVSGDLITHNITNSNSLGLIKKSLVRKVEFPNPNTLVLTGKFGTNQSLRIVWVRTTGPQ